MVRTNGIRKVGGGWKDPFYKPRTKASRPARTQEEIAADEKRMQDFIEAQGWNKPAEPQQRALEKIVDADARRAVEGDSAIHDAPFGESVE